MTEVAKGMSFMRGSCSLHGTVVSCITTMLDRKARPNYRTDQHPR